MSTFKDARGRWRYRFSFKGRRYKGSAPKERNLERVAAALEKQLLERLVARTFTGEIPTVSGFIVTFLEHQKARVKPLTHENQTYHLQHVEPHLGKLRIDEVGIAELDRLITLWKRDAAPRTINSRMDTVRRMLTLAADWKMIPFVPKVAAVKVPKDTPRFLSEVEAVALVEAADPGLAERSDALEWRSMIVVGLRTGMRIGELRGLQWGDVDLDRRVVYVRRTDPGRKAHTSTSPKGGRGRMIPLTPDAYRALDELAHERGAVGPGQWVWPGQNDASRTRAESNCKHAIDRYAKRAGLKDVGWHTLRHTFASWLVIRGIPLRVVQELLGHASIKQTERYAHLSSDAINHSVVASLDLPMAPSSPALPSGEDDEP